MTCEHLDEIVELIAYLWSFTEPLEVIDKKIDKYVYPESRVQVRAEIDQARQKVIEYPQRSCFGKSRKNITYNARKHIESCFDCYQKYFSIVNQEAEDCAKVNVQEIIDQAKQQNQVPEKGFTEEGYLRGFNVAKKHFMGFYDKLNILRPFYVP